MSDTKSLQPPTSWPRAASGLVLAVVLLCIVAVPNAAVRAQSTPAAGKLNVTISDAVAITETGDLRLFVFVSDGEGRPVPGLGKEAIRLFERADPGDPKPVEAFTVTTESAERAAPDTEVPPMAISLAMDLSTSMAGQAIAEARAAAIDFIDGRPDGDLFALYTFGVGARQVLDFSPDKATIKGTIAELDATEKGTSLFDAITLVADDLGRRDGRRAFVVLSDGQNDAAGGKTDRNAIDAARNSGATGFMLGFGSTADKVLTDVAEASGGRALVRPGPDQIAGLLGDVGTLLDQYLITYHPSFPNAVSKLRVDVEIESNGRVGSDFVIGVANPNQGAILVPTVESADGAGGGADEGEARLPVGLIAGVAIALLLLGGAVLMRRRPAPLPPVDAGWSSQPVPNLCLQCGYPAHQHAPNCPVLSGPASWMPGTERQSVPGIAPTEHALPPSLPPTSAPAPWPSAAPSAPVPPAPAPSAPAPVGGGTTRRLDRQDMDSPKTRRLDRPVMARAHLVVAEGTQPGTVYPLSTDDIMIGRGENCQVRLDDATVSRDHARLRYQNGRYHIYDQSPTNPSRIDGQPAHGRALQPGDRVTLGRTVAVYYDGPPPSA